MRTALIRDDQFLINLNQVTYGRVAKEENDKWKFTLYIGTGSQYIFWTYTTEEEAYKKLEDILQKANEISLTEILG